MRALWRSQGRRECIARRWAAITRWYSESTAALAAEEESAAPPLAKVPVPQEAVLDVLYAAPRVESGTRACMKMRNKGIIPGIVCSQEDGHQGGHKQLLVLNSNKLNLLLKKFGQSFFMSRLYTLELRTEPDPKEGELISRERVLPRLIHVHAVSDKVLNATFIRAPPHARLRVDIPLVFIGADVCPGIRKGGYLNTIRRTVQYYGAPDLIPKYIEVDLSNLEAGQSVRIKDLNVTPGLVVYAMDPRWPVCKIVGTRATRVATAS
ncbi:hypothetical protein SELMODRAFT_149576 [Selaginella moellendorffii]|uniref:Uncharacterized protein n=1 Tax=Selaginella moellendorffii TaxID=88036 RepID=D8RST2_SELML|nr:uncharacterized protein LOC9656330 [Selaginella moellendorffii]EFJ25126.1 hypothetical protein SELMODRAFT_149576 [Selaginella moellendorffii]|eukprot:XP_002974171.1 uncharacterized protein LOC9656330 [Selaginella moellendorffii]